MNKKQKYFLMEQSKARSWHSWKVHSAKTIQTLYDYYQNNIANEWDGERTFYIVNANKATDARCVINDYNHKVHSNSEFVKEHFGEIIKIINHKGI